MNWLYKEFLPLCQEHGIDLKSEDIRYIMAILGNIPQNEHRAIMGRYFDEWCKGIGAAYCGSQRQYMGRKYANKVLIHALER